MLMLTTGALITAAGFSSRMGSCKATIKIAERSSLAWTVNSLQEAGVDKILIVTGHWREETEKEAASLGCVTIHNDRYASGMFSSVITGIKAIPREWDRFFFLPVDIPLIRPSTLTRIMTEAVGPLSYPTFLGERGHPPLISRSLIPVILSWSGKEGLKGALQVAERDSQDIPVADQAILRDMDVPEDHERLCDMASRRDLPSEDERRALELMAGTPENVLRHEVRVTKTAMQIADMMEKAGAGIDRDLLVAGAMLHDLCRTQRAHGRAGATMLRTHGYRAIASLVEKHMDYPYDGNLDEGAVLYLADKITCQDRICPLEERLRGMLEKFKSDPQAQEGAVTRLKKAEKILRHVSQVIGRDIMGVLN